MNKNVVGIILIVVALVLVFFYGWPKLKPYLSPPPPPPAGGVMGPDGEPVPGGAIPGAPPGAQPGAQPPL